MNNILVIGANGMLGFAVSSYFERSGYRVSRLTRREFDIARQPVDAIAGLVKMQDLVVNCAGVIKPRIPETAFEDILRVNSVFPKNLAKQCARSETKCIHITTDCVFSGKKGGYSELDPYDAEDVYGLSKAAGDTGKCMTLRTSIIGPENGHQRSLLEWVFSQKGREVNGFTTHLWNGVTTLQLAKIIEAIVQTGKYAPGIYHIHSPGAVSKFQLLQEINRVYGLDLTIHPVAPEVAVDRSLSSVFSYSKKFSTVSIEKQLEELREFFEKEQNEPVARAV